MMKRLTLVFAVCVLCFVTVGCKKEAKAPASQAQPAGDMAPVGTSITGKVVETMNAGGYTYLSVDNNGKKTWVAIPATPVKVGQMVTCQPGI